MKETEVCPDCLMPADDVPVWEIETYRIGRVPCPDCQRKRDCDCGCEDCQKKTPQDLPES